MAACYTLVVVYSWLVCNWEERAGGCSGSVWSWWKRNVLVFFRPGIMYKRQAPPINEGGLRYRCTETALEPIRATRMKR